MRSKSPSGRGKTAARFGARRQSYSSASSYSSSRYIFFLCFFSFVSVFLVCSFLFLYFCNVVLLLTHFFFNTISFCSFIFACTFLNHFPLCLFSSSRSTSPTSKSSYRGDSRSRSRSPTSRVRRRVAVPKSPSHRVHRLPVAGSSSGGPPHRAVSPSVIVSEKKAANERAALMNPPAPSPKKAHKDNRPPSPGMMRTSAQNPPAPTKV